VGSRSIAKKEEDMFGSILTGRRWAKLALLGALLVIAAVSLAATAPSSRQAARHTLLACGDTITTNITLTSDLACVASNGLNVGADGIVIDLNGHTISGDGTHNGIYNSGHTNVVIKNGTISHFLIGVELLAGANSNTVQNVRTKDNDSAGIFVNVSSSDQLTGNSAFLNTSAGIIVQLGSGNQLTGNWVEANGADGIEVVNSSGFVVSRNTALNNHASGIEPDAGASGLLSRNVANGNGNDGISVADSVVTLTRNRASFNGLRGINAAPGNTDGGKNVVQDNTSATQCANVVCTEVTS
jgi:parallel beta-helix repeat protein